MPLLRSRTAAAAVVLEKASDCIYPGKVNASVHIHSFRENEEVYVRSLVMAAC